MKIWVLTENTACREELGCEHGLSLYLETGNRKILFDAGQSALFAENAAKMGVDLSAVDTAILSHGHYDHGGGFGRFLEINSKAKIYVNQEAFRPHYNGKGEKIGLEPELLKSGRIVLTGDRCDLGDGLRLQTCNGNTKMFPIRSFGQTVLENGLLRQEDYRHEQYLTVREGGRNIVISGCSHKGMENIVSWLAPDVLVGGFHFMKMDPRGDALRQAAQRLSRGSTVYFTGHCTGREQFWALKKTLADRLHSLSAGSVIEL